MEFLSERLEIRLHPETLHLLAKKARQRNLSIAQLVRQAIEAFLEEIGNPGWRPHRLCSGGGACGQLGTDEAGDEGRHRAAG